MREDLASTPSKLHFGVFDLDVRAGELRRSGVRVKLQEQPFRILAILLERPGEVVTREQLRQQLWPGDTFVDFEHSINITVKRLREALGDSADNPRFIETMPRHGYRFIAPVEPVAPASPPALVEARTPPRQKRRWLAVIVMLALVIIGVFVLRERFRQRAMLPAAKTMLVVLPFENLSGDPAQEYLSDGLTEELITQLGGVEPSRLGVIARTSAMQFKRDSKDVREIGHELGVDYVLEGSIRREINRVRVSAQLIQVSDQGHLWAASYDRELGGILALQYEIARAVVQQITVRVAPQAAARPAAHRSVNPEALDAYLRGIYRLRQGRSDSGTTAVPYFEQAAEIQPGWALPYSGLAWAHFWNATDPNLDLADRREFFRKLKTAALSALELDDTLADAHCLLGDVLQLYEWNWAGAKREFERALELNPGDAGAHAGYATWLSIMGQHQKAIPELSRAIELDPLFVYYRTSLGTTYLLAHRYDEAITYLEGTARLNPDICEAHYFLAGAYALRGRYKDAFAELEKGRAVRNPPSEVVYQANLAWIEAMAGRREEALRIVEENPALLTNVKQPTAVAGFYGAIGNADEAFRWLEIAFKERDPKLPKDRWSPDFDSLRSDPRYQDLLHRMNLPQ